MNTDRSNKMAEEFLAKGHPYQRATQTTEHLFHAPPEVVFKQLCPTREADWIDGWEADLIHTTSGYVEEDCIFTTPPSNIIGPGLWVFTRLEPNELLELVRIIDDMVVIHFRIDLRDNGDDTCTGIWTLKFTALNEQGNAFVDSLPDEDPLLKQIIGGLGHFVTKGELMAIR
jgi:hypothetical protein